MCSECHLLIDSFGTPTFVDVKGKPHCLGGPAVVWGGGAIYYYRHGKLHRDGDLPAVIWDDGRNEYWVNGLRHRDGDEPAVIWADGSAEYWVNGELVRTDHV